MNNFRRIAVVDVIRLQVQVLMNRHLFMDLPKAKLKPGDVGYSHREGSLIILRYPNVPADAANNPEARKAMEDDLFSVNREPWDIFTELKPLLYGLMREVEGTHIGGIGIIKLPAGKKIDEHYDTGLATEFYNRYHLILQGPSLCWFTCGEGGEAERVAMRDGEVWWFNSKKKHSVINDSQADRISVSIDIGVM